MDEIEPMSAQNSEWVGEWESVVTSAQGLAVPATLTVDQPAAPVSNSSVKTAGPPGTALASAVLASSTPLEVSTARTW
ncbi:MAG: hypothetical protein HY825_00675 [Acidobacteria bacterium]|nr:hypothetical protein [Acidobacteriota bacterium]